MNGLWHLSCVMCLANRFFCKFQCRIQRLHELIELDGLGYIAEESYFQAPLDVAGHGIGTDGNDGDVRRGRVTRPGHGSRNGCDHSSAWPGVIRDSPGRSAWS